MNDQLKLFTPKNSNPKKRVIKVVVGILLVAFVLFTLWHHTSSKKTGFADVGEAPTMASLPGAGNPSNQYIKDQNLQNQQQALAARKEATSNVPTLTRPNFVGNPDQFGVLPNANNGTTSQQCPMKKLVVMYKPNPASCSLDNLRLAKQAGVTAEELVCQGCACPVLKAAGYTLGDLKSVGLSAQQLKDCGFNLDQLVAAGFSAAELKNAGFTADQLKAAGFSANELKNAGFSAQDLKAAGFSAKDLKAAGFTANDLKSAGYNPQELKDAGFSAKELKDAGFTANDLKNAGFSDKEIAAASAGSQAAQTIDVCSPENIKKARASGISATDLKSRGCDLAALHAGGFSAADLKAAGYSAKELKDAGFTPEELKAAGYSAGELKAAGFTAGQLKAAGYKADELKTAGFSPQELRDAGYTAAELKAAGFTPTELAQAGFSKGDLLRAGFTPEEAGYAKPVVADGNRNNNANADNQAYMQGPPLSQYNSNRTRASASMPSINTPEGQLKRLAAITQRQMNAQQQADMVQEMQGGMTMQAQKMLAAWSNSPTQTEAVAVITDTHATQGGGTAPAAPTGPTIKAGSVMYAVLDTAINSDENSPIMARIVTGQLKGAKLLGQFSRVDKRVLINFNLINLPNCDRSLHMNGVAIDPDTARTALAGEVNNHYLLRYGTLFASAFLQGLSSAVLTSGTTIFPTPYGPGYVHPELSAGQSALVGLGTVGQQYASRMGNNFDRPPTIKVEGGTGIGILIMDDLTLPA